MSTDIVSPSTPPPYRIVQIRVPVVSGRAWALGALAVVLAVAVAFGGISLYRRHVTGVRLADARGEMAASVQDAAKRSRDALDRAEYGLRGLATDLDKALAAKSSDGVDLNAYVDEQGRIGADLAQAGAALAGLDARAAQIRDAQKLPGDADLLAAKDRTDLDALAQRRQADTDGMTASDARIKLAAQHRAVLAKAEAAASAAASARRAAAAEQAAAAQQPSTSPPPPPSYYSPYAGYSPYYSYPYYPYYRSYYGPTIWIGGSWGGHRGGHRR